MKPTVQEVKLELANDILRHHNSIFYELTDRSKEVLSLVRFKKKEGDAYNFTQVEFEKIESFLFATSEQRKFYQLGILSKNCEKELEIKKDLYNKL